MIVVDTSVWADYFNGRRTRQTDTFDLLLGNQAIIIGDLILTEILQGFRSDEHLKQARALLRPFPVVTMLGPAMAIQSAENYRQLRKCGVTVRKTIDVMIGTYCIENNLPLLSSDKDFDPMVEHLGLLVSS